MKTLNLDWTANARGLDGCGTPIVAVYGSENMNAVDRSQLIEQAPTMFAALQRIAESVKEEDLNEYGEFELRERMKTIRALALSGNSDELRRRMADQL